MRACAPAGRAKHSGKSAAGAGRCVTGDISNAHAHAHGGLWGRALAWYAPEGGQNDVPPDLKNVSPRSRRSSANACTNVASWAPRGTLWTPCTLDSLRHSWSCAPRCALRLSTKGRREGAVQRLALQRSGRRRGGKRQRHGLGRPVRCSLSVTCVRISVTPSVGSFYPLYQHSSHVTLTGHSPTTYGLGFGIRSHPTALSV